MAEIIEHFPGPQHQSTRRYPWDEWCDGQVRKLIRGEDFDAPVDQFRNRLYPQANNRGLKVRSAKRVGAAGEEVLVIQFYDPGLEPPAETGAAVWDDEPAPDPAPEAVS